MVGSLLRLTGLDQKLEELKRDLQTRADAALDHLKSVVVQVAVAAGLVVGAGVFGVLAMLTGLVAAYIWAEAKWGPFVALGIIGGALALLALVLLVAGLSAARSKASGTAQPSQEPARSVKTPVTSLPAPQAAAVSATRPELLTAELPAAANMVEPFMSLVKQYARVPTTGLEPIDSVLRQMQPHAQVATDDAIKRAAVLVQTGDRTTMIAILGAAAALGWLVVRSTDKNEAAV
jgi:Putative Actinobacterial Holin-X, holin superfamily III